MQKPVQLIPIPLPPADQRRCRDARFATEGERRNRYHLPASLESASPVGYRRRLPLTQAEADQASSLLSLEPPEAFLPGPPPTEGELFEEAALGVLTARQSTNYRGHRQVLLGPADSDALVPALRELKYLDHAPLTGAAYTAVVLSRPYRTAFTPLLTFVGHRSFASVYTVPRRAWRKKYKHEDDIPTIGYLQHLHIGILADAMERAALLASGGARRANVLMAPFSGWIRQQDNTVAIAKVERKVGLSEADRALGWRVALVVQVGAVEAPSPIDPVLCRKIAANFISFRSERIQPGVNAEEKAPPQYQERQDMDVPEALTLMAGRAAYNAFERWTGLDRELVKGLLLLDRIDVLTGNGKERLRAVRKELEETTDKVVANLPLWADLPLGMALSKNAKRGRKAFALAGQRIYVGGLPRAELEAAGLDLSHAVRAFGAAASRSALVCELAGCIDLPPDLDLLAGVCLMAGPVNQNDIGKQFYGGVDLLEGAHPGRDATALLVWTLKAKTVADPIGNEEQLMNPAQKGALVDLRPGPHEVVTIRAADGTFSPMRARDGRLNAERAFGDQDNFVTDPSGGEIAGNRGSPWPLAWSQERPWS